MPEPTEWNRHWAGLLASIVERVLNGERSKATAALIATWIEDELLWTTWRP